MKYENVEIFDRSFEKWKSCTRSLHTSQLNLKVEEKRVRLSSIILSLLWGGEKAEKEGENARRRTELSLRNSTHSTAQERRAQERRGEEGREEGGETLSWLPCVCVCTHSSGETGEGITGVHRRQERRAQLAFQSLRHSYLDISARATKTSSLSNYSSRRKGKLSTVHVVWCGVVWCNVLEQSC